MAHYSTKKLIAFLFFTVLSLSLAQAQVASPPVDAVPIAAVYLRGILYCTADGNPIKGVVSQPLVGRANLTVFCNNGTITLGNSVSDINGIINTLVQVTDTLIYNPSECYAQITVTNVVNCKVFVPDSVLRGSLALLGTTIVEGIGLAARFSIGLFEVIFKP